ncbi:hypothetical protein GOBAR_AA34541 [Gossypium barbadense]|uniref:RNase H type-1 domain-containing protein n=1 Tax=Gossypium barbadense TaxID=3634 RepID=A0A2P5W511_GOSBA|nr:hypothetical protein GOBAR_AA34541 [Gossypium barbadense]
MTVDTLLFHSKMRALIEARAAHDKPPSPRWIKFSVPGVIMEDEASSGGGLRDNKGVAYVMFSRPIEATGLGKAEVRAIKIVVEMFMSIAIGLGKAEVRAIKIVVEMFMSIGWHEKVPLVIESSSSVVLEGLLDRSYRPWMLRNLFIGIGCDINLLLRAQFTIIQ